MTRRTRLHSVCKYFQEKNKKEKARIQLEKGKVNRFPNTHKAGTFLLGKCL